VIGSMINADGIISRFGYVHTNIIFTLHCHNAVPVLL
jgi:hypothetical protein